MDIFFFSFSTLREDFSPTQQHPSQAQYLATGGRCQIALL